jgi:hypothetical protein
MLCNPFYTNQQPGETNHKIKSLRPLLENGGQQFGYCVEMWVYTVSVIRYRDIPGRLVMQQGYS